MLGNQKRDVFCDASSRILIIECSIKYFFSELVGMFLVKLFGISALKNSDIPVHHLGDKIAWKCNPSIVPAPRPPPEEERLDWSVMCQASGIHPANHKEQEQLSGFSASDGFFFEITEPWIPLFF